MVVETGPFIVDLPTKSGDFPQSVLLVYHRVCLMSDANIFGKWEDASRLAIAWLIFTSWDLRVDYCSAPATAPSLELLCDTPPDRDSIAVDWFTIAGRAFGHPSTVRSILPSFGRWPWHSCCGCLWRLLEGCLVWRHRSATSNKFNNWPWSLSGNANRSLRETAARPVAELLFLALPLWWSLVSRCLSTSERPRPWLPSLRWPWFPPMTWLGLGLRLAPIAKIRATLSLKIEESSSYGRLNSPRGNSPSLASLLSSSRTVKSP